LLDHSVRFREETILQRTCGKVSRVAGYRKHIASHRSEPHTDIGSYPAVSFVNASRHATPAKAASRCPLGFFLFSGFANRAFEGASLFVCKHLETVSAFGTHETLAALASRRFIKRHLNSPD
jgi:hypothetical protein